MLSDEKALHCEPKTQNPQALKPLSLKPQASSLKPQALKPSSLKPSSPQALKPSMALDLSIYQSSLKPKPLSTINSLDAQVLALYSIWCLVHHQAQALKPKPSSLDLSHQDQLTVRH